MSDETRQHDGPEAAEPWLDARTSHGPRRWARAVVLGTLLASVPACGATSTISNDDDASTSVDQYFVGTRRVHASEGRDTEHTVVGFRLLRPTEHRIVEELVVGDTVHVAQEHWQLDLDATLQRAVYRDVRETQGEGELRGTPWHWTSWHLECRPDARTSVTTDATLSATELRRVSRVLGADGSLVSESVEVLSPVTREQYERARTALVGPSPAQ